MLFSLHLFYLQEMSDHFEVLVLIPGFTSKDEVAAEIQHGILMLSGQKAKLAEPDQQVRAHNRCFGVKTSYQGHP